MGELLTRDRFPPGKIPWEHLARKVSLPLPPEVVLGPARGEDAALIRVDGETWAVASDPITFTTADAGRLAVLINANDVAVRGARPLYFTAVLLVAPEASSPGEVDSLLGQIGDTCRKLGIALIGGHSEVTPGLPRTIVVGTMLGRVTGRPIFTGGLEPGDRVGLTKTAGLEGTSILLNEFADRLHRICPPALVDETRKRFDRDWISVLPEAAAAARNPSVTAMHDVTEGGVGEALFEMARASGCRIETGREKIPVLEATSLFCDRLGIDPLGLIGSGALLVGCREDGARDLERALAADRIPFAWIGRAGDKTKDPESGLPRFERDEILKAWLLDGTEAFIFDMDGTLIDSTYDWQAIKSSLGTHGRSIIDDLNGMKSPEREEKWALLHRIEREATKEAQLKEGAADLLAFVKEKAIKTALVTNNSRENTDFLLENFGLSFDVVVTRDSGLWKPSGAPVTEAMRLLGVLPEKTLCIGDSRYDVLACREAGCASICILHDKTGLFSPESDISFPEIADFLQYLSFVL